MLYGKYVERFNVSQDPYPGYKSANILWPTTDHTRNEIDFPEGAWNSTFCAHVHNGAGTAQQSFCLNDYWTNGWHTTEIDWEPNVVTFYLDGVKIGQVTGSWVPEIPMSWIIQNESSLGAGAPKNSSAQINIDYMAVYSYQGTLSGRR